MPAAVGPLGSAFAYHEYRQRTSHRTPLGINSSKIVNSTTRGVSAGKGDAGKIDLVGMPLSENVPLAAAGTPVRFGVTHHTKVCPGGVRPLSDNVSSSAGTLLRYGVIDL